MVAVSFNKPHQRVVAASGLTNLADGIRAVALPLLALQLTSSPFLLAVVFAAGQAPWLLLGLWAGGLADRLDRRMLAQRVALARTGLLALMAVLILLEAVPIALLIAAAFVLGTSEVMADSVNGTLIPDLVPEADLERANSRMVGAEIAGNELVGPALGGLLFAVAASVPFFTNAGLLSLAFVLLAGLPLVGPGSGAENIAGPVSDVGSGEETAGIRAGLEIVRDTPLLRTITWSSALLAGVDGAWFALIALIITVELGMSAAALGLFLAIGALGGLAGAAFADRKPELTLAWVATAVFATMAIPLVCLALFTNPFVVGFALVLTSAAFALWNVFMVSARQRVTPTELLGRVGAAYRTCVAAAGLLGMLAGGAMAQLASVQATLAASAAILVAGAVLLTGRFSN